MSTPDSSAYKLRSEFAKRLLVEFKKKWKEKFPKDSEAEAMYHLFNVLGWDL